MEPNNDKNNINNNILGNNSYSAINLTSGLDYKEL